MRGNMNTGLDQGWENQASTGGGGGIGSSGFQGGNVVVNNNYVSVQTGEEFSSEFIRDRLTPKVAHGVHGFPVVHNQEIGSGFNNDQESCQMGYEELARILGLRRIDSECGSDVTEFSSSQGCRSHRDRRCHIDDTDSAQVRGSREVNGSSNFDQFDLGDKVSPIVIPPSSISSNPYEPGSSDGSQAEKMRILCSFGGRILPRPSDSKLRYVGGETRIISVTTNISWEELVHKTSGLCNQPYTIKYQLPGEDLDALISVSSDEDLQNMMEEYGGVERSAGSQRLRIFLIPASETENRTSGTLQQTTPDYEYVVAVNGIVDPSPRKSSGDQLFTDKGKPVAALDRTPSFHGESPASLHHVESKDALSFSQASHMRKEVLDPLMSPTESPLFSMNSAQHNLPGGLVQWHEDSLWQHSGESNSSLNTTQLPFDNLYAKPSVQGQKSYFQAHNGGACLITPPLTDGNQNIGQPSLLEGRPVHHERYMSQVDSRGFMLGSVDSIDSHHGMIHAYSDSQLQQYGDKSSYCSQEGMSPSSPLHFSKRVVSSQALSSPLQDNIVHLQENIHSVQLDVTNQLVDIEPSPPQFRADIPVPLSSDPLAGNPYLECLHNATYQRPQKGVDEGDKANYFIQKPQYSDPLGFQMMNISHMHQGTTNPVVFPPMLMNHNGYHINPDALVHQEAASTSIDATLTSGCIANSVYSSKTENTSCGLVNNLKHSESQPCNFTGEITTESLARSQSAMVQSHGQDQPMNPLSGVLGDSYVPMGQQPVACLRDEVSEGQTLINALDEYPSIVHNASTHNPHRLDNGAAYEGGNMFLFDDFNGQLEPGVGKLGDRLGKKAAAMGNEISRAEPVSVHNQRQPEPLLLVEEMTHFTPLTAAASSRITTDVVDSITDGSEHPYVPVRDGVRTVATSAGGLKDDTVIDAVMAEVEAGLYGLQIIKNADLEELRELGSGTYGTVYHGKWRGSDVAIKRIKKSCFSGRSSEQERLTGDFWREAQILSKLHHPNVVAFYGVVPDGFGGTLATVTEFMVNGSLRNVLLKKDRSLDRRRKLIIAMDAAFGMEYLHSKNIVHFDLKCDNLLVNMRDVQRPVCKVGDFGLSRIKRNTLVSGGVRGTLPWMAPELLNGSSNKVSEKVDVFSFGIALWEILTGEEPYANMHCGAIIGGILKNTLRPPIPERCDPEWRKLMEQCWSVDPDARPSFTEVTSRLRLMSAAVQSRGNHNQKSLALG
ncbi:hypothetical protein KSS87_013353 [Heliosperma pusillum]|nr:hypothetical protein KSS87_013353 [Heliosperma pusillum]